MSGRTQIISTHWFRRVARKEERRIQDRQDEFGGFTGLIGIPNWSRGVRVEKAGPFQWAVVATEERGH